MHAKLFGKGGTSPSSSSTYEISRNVVARANIDEPSPINGFFFKNLIDYIRYTIH